MPRRRAPTPSAAPAAQAAPSAPAYPRAEAVHAYARGVVSGEIPAGRLVRLACQRHLDDLATASTRGLEFRPAKAEAFLLFASGVNLAAGKPLRLDAWQIFCGGSLFGWYGADGFRRFHTAYIEIAKGNGKTPFGAVVGLYMFLLDGEIAPEIYSAGVTQDQASIPFKDARMMVEATPYLRARVQVQVASLSARDGVFRPLSAEHRSLDGKRVHLGLIEELHEHPNDLVVDKIDAGTKQRRNALILEITNSGVGRQSVCWRHHESSVAILEGRGPGNDAWFAYIATLDPCPECLAAGKPQPDPKCPRCDDWRTNPATWVKANPALDTILPRAYLEKQVAGARSMVSKENIVARLNFCQWTEQTERWLSMLSWDQCAGPLTPAALAAALAGAPCKAALDASTVSDFSALVLQFCLTGAQLAARHPAFARLAPDLTYFPTLADFFIPADNLSARIKSTGLRFDLWRDQGYLHATPGNIIDYAWIEKRLAELASTYLIEEIGFDPWNITDLITRLSSSGFQCVPIRQGFATLSPPAKATEKDIAAARLLHAGHPVLRWMASNVAKSEDAAGNIKPDKERSTEKIDGIVALIMARDRWLRREPTSGGDAGILFL